MDGFQFAVFGTVIKPPSPADSKNFTYHAIGWQYYSNSRSFVENASRRYGLQIALIGTVSVDDARVGENVNRYSFALPGQNPDYTAMGDHHDATQPVEESVGLYFSAPSGLSRMILKWSGLGTSSSGYSSYQFGPASYWAQHSSASTYAGATNFDVNMVGELHFRPNP